MKSALLCALVGLPITVAAQTFEPVLLKDICTSGFIPNSNPNTFTNVGDRVYFVASENGTNRNVWVTDGTEAGTTSAAIDDFNSTFAVINMLPFNDGALVIATNGTKVYHTDGTDAGETTIISDLSFTYDYAFDAKNAFIIDDVVYFWASSTGDGAGAELYKSDGTTAGTGLFMDIAAGATKSYCGSTAYQHAFQASDDKAFFIASAGDSNRLYVTDGTVSGTSAIKTFHNTYILNDAYFFHTAVNDHAIIIEKGNIWSVDLTTNEVTLLDPYNVMKPLYTFYSANDLVYYLRSEAVAGTTYLNVWSTDGESITQITNQKTVRGGSIYPISYSTRNAGADGKFFFFNHTAILNDVELWVCDGTDAGTVKVIDSIGVSGQGVDYFYACNDRTFYYKTGADNKLFEIDMDSYEMTMVLDQTGVTGGIPFLDENNCRFYIAHIDSVAQNEPHTIDLGAPVDTTSGYESIANTGTLQLYPNPSNGDFQIHVNGIHREVARVYNLQGVLVSEFILMPGQNDVHLNVPSGMYILQSSTDRTRFQVVR